MGTVEVRGTMFPLHMVYHPLIGPILFATNMTHIFCRKEKQICYTLFWAMKIVCQVVMVHDIEGHMKVHIPVTDRPSPPKKSWLNLNVVFGDFHTYDKGVTVIFPFYGKITSRNIINHVV